MNQEPSIIDQFSATTSRIPWLKKQAMSARVFIVAILLAVLVIGSWVASSRATEHEILTKTVWCADTIIVNGVTRLQPNSFGLRTDFSKGTTETFQLKDDGTAVFPGFNSYPVKAKWRSEDIYIEVYDADTFGYIYNNVYEYYISPEFLKLVSEDVMISGSRNGAY